MKIRTVLEIIAAVGAVAGAAAFVMRLRGDRASDDDDDGDDDGEPEGETHWMPFGPRMAGSVADAHFGGSDDDD